MGTLPSILKLMLQGYYMISFGLNLRWPVYQRDFTTLPVVSSIDDIYIESQVNPSRVQILLESLGFTITTEKSYMVTAHA